MAHFTLFSRGKQSMLFMVLLLCSLAAKGTIRVDNLWYELNSSDMTATVVRSTSYGYALSKDYVVPSVVYSKNLPYTVTKIGDHAFA